MLLYCSAIHYVGCIHTVAVAPRSATQQNFVRQLTTTPAARMSDSGKKLFDDSELKQRLSEMEYAVTQLKNTEP